MDVLVEAEAEADGGDARYLASMPKGWLGRSLPTTGRASRTVLLVALSRRNRCTPPNLQPW